MKTYLDDAAKPHSIPLYPVLCIVRLSIESLAVYPV
jgi:hypothetical protein